MTKETFTLIIALLTVGVPALSIGYATLHQWWHKRTRVRDSQVMVTRKEAEKIASERAKRMRQDAHVLLLYARAVRESETPRTPTAVEVLVPRFPDVDRDGTPLDQTSRLLRAVV